MISYEEAQDIRRKARVIGCINITIRDFFSVIETLSSSSPWPSEFSIGPVEAATVMHQHVLEEPSFP